MEKRKGRPPGGSGQGDEPELIRKYPRLSLTIRPSTKRMLEAIALLERRPAWLVVDQAVIDYLGAMKPEDRQAIEVVLKRMEVGEQQTADRRLPYKAKAHSG